MASANLNLSYQQDIWDIKCSVSEISASGNNRTITLKLEVRTDDGFTGGRDGGYHVNCSEGGDVGEKTCVVPGSSQSRLVIYDKTFDVYVAPGQTYADISFDFEIHFYSPSVGATRSLSGTIDRISGLSVIAGVSISSAKDIYFGDKVSITWTPPASAFAYILKFTLGSYTYTTGMLTPNTTNSYTYSDLTVPVSAASNIPNSVSGSMSVTITQYKNSSSSETVGSSVTKSFKVTLKDSFVPTISTCIASLDNKGNATVASWGIGLVGYSKIKISATASGIYGSTIKSFSISGGYTASVSGSSLNYTGDTITSSGNKSFTVTCTDSRGRKSSSVTTNIVSILPYTPPKLISMSTSKEEYGDTNVLNDRMVVTASWEYDTINGKNSASGAAYYKESSATDWFKHSGIVKNNTPFTLSELQLDDEKSYNVKVVVTDSVGNSSDKSSFSSTTKVLLDFMSGGEGLGVGKICEKPGMEVSMNATFYNQVNLLRDSKTYEIEEYINSIAASAVTNGMKDIGITIANIAYPVGSVYISVNATSPKTLLGIGEWERLEDRFLLASGTTYEAGSEGGAATVTLNENQIPRHTHEFQYSTDGGYNWSTASMGRDGNYSDANYLGTKSSVADFSSYQVRIGKTGGSSSHNNMPPYIAVYMWKRIA